MSGFVQSEPGISAGVTAATVIVIVTGDVGGVAKVRFNVCVVVPVAGSVIAAVAVLPPTLGLSSSVIVTDTSLFSSAPYSMSPPV